MDQHILAGKWFIDTTGQEPLLRGMTRSELDKHWFPPQTRHDGANMADYTVDNDVTPLLDGENIFPAWHTQITNLIQNPQNAQLMHSGWIMNGIAVRHGEHVPKLIRDLVSKKGEVFVALSDHYYNMNGNRQMVGMLGIKTAATDSRYPDLGSMHAKFTVFKDGIDDSAMVGSADFWTAARSQQSHQLNRQHEVSALLKGPAVGDVEQSFVNRWNDPTRDDIRGCLDHYTADGASMTPPTMSPNALQTQTSGSHAVQVTQTFGIDYDDDTYSWANDKGGEFTAWAARLRAISEAQDYIYIEDQYFVPFADPYATATPAGFVDVYRLAMKSGSQGSGYKWAPFTLLRERLLAGVDVFVITNLHIDGSFAYTAEYARIEGLIELRDAAAQSGSGDLVVATLEANGNPYGTHAKLMICDDEYVSLGSANFNRRSMTNDTELQISVVDADGTLVPDVRTASWAEHLQVSTGSLTDLDAAKATFTQRVANSQGRVRPFEIPGELDWWRPPFQGDGINKWDHYAGPADMAPLGGR